MSVLDVMTERVAEIPFDRTVAFGACIVDVDFPTDAAGVGAFGCNAMEGIVKFRNAEKHF